MDVHVAASNEMHYAVGVAGKQWDTPVRTVEPAEIRKLFKESGLFERALRGELNTIAELTDSPRQSHRATAASTMASIDSMRAS